MSGTVRVRLVPKNKQGESLTMHLHQLTGATAKRYAPDADRAEVARNAAMSVGIDSTVSSQFGLDSIVPLDKFESHFGTKLVNQKRKESEFSMLSSGTDEFWVPNKELDVPDELKDTIAFAYVPTPPEFCAPSFVPPNASVYHLRLGDVLRALGGGPCHRRGWTGRGVRVAMADSGFARHPYFANQGYNIQRIATPSLSHPAVDPSGHGTGESANLLIMAPDCRFFGIKHNDYSVEALETSLAQNPRLLCNSWGWNIDHQSFNDFQQSDPNLYNEVRDIERTITDAIDDGVTVIFAAGNGHRMFPACMPDVIAVGGTTVEADGELKASSYASSFRSQLYPGREVPDFCGVVGESGNSPMKGHIMLPVPNGSTLEGENLPNSQSNKGWAIFSGTSAATPQVSGIVALMLSIDPSLTPADIRTILADTAVDVQTGETALGDSADIGHDLATGAGIVNATAACLMVEQLMHNDP